MMGCAPAMIVKRVLPELILVRSPRGVSIQDKAKPDRASRKTVAVPLTARVYGALRR